MTIGPRHRWRIRPLAMVRLVAAISLLAVGAVHIQQYTAQDYRFIPTIGPLFLLNFIGGTVLGVYFLVPAGARAGRVRLLLDAVAALAGLFLAAGALVALLVSEHTPLFGFMEHGYRFAIVFAIASEAVAVVTVTILLVLTRAAARRNRGLRRRPRSRRRAPQTRSGSDVKLYSLTLSGLDVRSDWRAIHDRLLDDFVGIDDVLPTTMPATLLIVYHGSPQIGGWLDSIDTAIDSRHARQPAHADATTPSPA